MTITREQVADLQPGDVVELAYDTAPDTVTRGPLQAWPDGTLRLAREEIRGPDGDVWNGYLRLLTVVSRAPRPLYVNHPRPSPALGDVVKDGNGDVRHALPPKSVRGAELYGANEIRWWSGVAEYDGEWLHCSTDYMPKPLTLLVDGETGQVVQ